MASKRIKRLCVIPDAQVKAGVDLSHLEAAGNLIMEKRPEVIVCLGDFADWESLSSYDKGKKAAEGRRIMKDMDAIYNGLQTLLRPLREHDLAHGATDKYRPRLVMTLGNHEDRVKRAANESPELEGLLPDMEAMYHEFAFETYPFLEPVVIGGVAFCHYFCSGPMGRPVTTAQALLTKKSMSCIAGHQQGYQIATQFRGDGAKMTGIIAGSFYSHKEDYLGPQGNRHWRGMLMLHDVADGEFYTQQLSLKHVKAKYGGWE